MAKRKAKPSTRVEAGLVTVSCEIKPSAAPEVCNQKAVKSIATGSGGDTRGVSNEEATPQRDVVARTATLAISPESTVAITVYVSRGFPRGDVARGGSEASANVLGPVYTQVVTRPDTGAHTEVGEGRGEAIEAFWSLLREAGYESW